MESRGALFREIHKNTWLKRVTIDNRKIPVGTKKPERYWVVFCVHDDCEALLEGYLEPRLAASHSPDWTLSLQTTLHISHTLVPSEQEYEFVITLLSDTVRFNASSWETMQEWVDTLRLKLREMKILSPKENLYSKLPEIRPVLLPTRDPMSPLPATPPVPAAIVPGVERIITSVQISRQTSSASAQQTSVITNATTAINTNVTNSTIALTNPSVSSSATSSNTSGESIVSSAVNSMSVAVAVPSTSMSNTLTQNLIKMLSNPVSTYSHQVNSIYDDSDSSLQTSPIEAYSTNSVTDLQEQSHSINGLNQNQSLNEGASSLAKTFANNVLADPNTCASTSGLSSYVSSVKREIGNNKENDNDAELSSLESFPSSVCPTPEPIVIPRPHTTRSLANKEKSAEIIIDRNTNDDVGTTNITIIQVSSPIKKEKFKFPATMETKESEEDDKYKSNVQIIPSNLTSNLYTQHTAKTLLISEAPRVTTVQINSDDIDINSISEQSEKTITTTTIITSSCNSSSSSLVTPCVSATTKSSLNNSSGTVTANIRNFGEVTNVPIGIEPKLSPPPPASPQQHYEQVFISQSTNISRPLNANENSDLSTALSPNFKFLYKQQKSASQIELNVNRIKLHKVEPAPRTVVQSNNEPSTSNSTVTVSGSATRNTQSTSSATQNDANNKSKVFEAKREGTSALIARRPLLTRGLTEAVILRPSRKDVNVVNRGFTKGAQPLSNTETQSNSLRQDVSEQRKRSSSTSDTQGIRNRANNNYVVGNTSNNNNTDVRRVQAPPQPFRANADISLHASGRLTLREQQVMQMRREMMHPGGVRLQLRRKDCISSIGFVEAFGAVWISGWKQKEHPMLYNALHIGDQMISIAGVTVTTVNECNKIIKNLSSLYIEFIIRRVPFGRIYAIRREIDRQCLGLIRDGNTATIVDVVPNSLSARHGLPPKAQSCDGLALTFWVLTEINGRPLNLFYKENEVKDRLNAVGRDISILVQPSDLITKLKKQLKSLRSYKEYIVQ